jgi:hypothetical protein
MATLMKKCRYCAQIIPAEALVCHICRREVDTPESNKARIEYDKKQQSKKWAIVCVSIAGLIALAWLSSGKTPTDSNKVQSNAATLSNKTPIDSTTITSGSSSNSAALQIQAPLSGFPSNSGFPSDSGSPSNSASPSDSVSLEVDGVVCAIALNWDRSAWDRKSIPSQKYVAEAERRSLTVDACRHVIGEDLIGEDISTTTSNPPRIPPWTPTFDVLTQRPDQVRGRLVMLTGKVIQTIEESGQSHLRINITKEKWGWKDTVLIAYEPSAFKTYTSQTKILEGDIIDVDGVSTGNISYKAVLGQTVTIPGIVACRITLHTGARWVTPDGC